MNPLEYHKASKVDKTCNLEQIIDLYKNCSLFEFMKEYSTEEVKKLIFTTMDAITLRGSNLAETCRNYADLLCEYLMKNRPNL